VSQTQPGRKGLFLPAPVLQSHHPRQTVREL
jgi:hypothetical protein